MVGDKDKHLYKTFGLGKPVFLATSQLKLEANEFFM